MSNLEENSEVHQSHLQHEAVRGQPKSGMTAREEALYMLDDL